MHAQLYSCGHRYSGMADEGVAIHTVNKGHLGRRANPCSAMGRVAGQLDAPFSFETCIALFNFFGRLSSISAAAAESSCFRCFMASFLALSCSALAS